MKRHVDNSKDEVNINDTPMKESDPEFSFVLSQGT